jgi:hypothetical protein
MRIPLTGWPGHSLSIPVGLELYLNPEQAHQLNVLYRSRSQLPGQSLLAWPSSCPPVLFAA